MLLRLSTESQDILISQTDWACYFSNSRHQYDMGRKLQTMVQHCLRTLTPHQKAQEGKGIRHSDL